MCITLYSFVVGFSLTLFTYPGVASLLEFLCNGLVRGHDNKHLDGHVEDGHGDQVGHIVSVERKMHQKGISINNPLYGIENANASAVYRS